MIDYSREVEIKVILIFESLLRLAYESGLEPLLASVIKVGIQDISAHVEGVRFEEPTRGYFEGGSEY